MCAKLNRFFLTCLKSKGDCVQPEYVFVYDTKGTRSNLFLYLISMDTLHRHRFIRMFKIQETIYIRNHIYTHFVCHKVDAFSE